MVFFQLEIDENLLALNVKQPVIEKKKNFKKTIDQRYFIGEIA